jgi:N-acetylmuramoyl-L-alanine amidase
MCSGCFETPPDEVEPTSSISSSMHRRDFLRLSGTGLAGAVLLGSASGRVFAQSRTPLKSEFQSASAKYKVPQELLLAMGYVNTLWEMPPPEASEYVPGDLHGRGTYGIMQLVQTPWEDTLGRAANLTGLSEERLKTERAANVVGGAAVLAGIAGVNRPSYLNGWYEAVAEYGGGELYAQEVFETLGSGASATISTGESLRLAPQDVEVPQIYTAAQGSADYGRALWRPAYRGNYTQANRGARWIKYLVIHIAQGSYSGTIDWFQNPRANVSAHYVVGRKGKIAQCVHNEDIAWHAGNWRFNRRSIGIEHAGYASERWWDRKYHSSAKLAAYLCRRFNIPPWRRYIRRHRGVPGVATRCPGRRFNKDRYLRLVRHYK